VAVFWHYKHFSSSFQSNSIGVEPPLYWFFPARFFFEYGDVMVDLFFVLSGVIFSYTYRTAVKTKKVGGYGFFMKRFSRLYPIHLFTLLLVVILVRIYYGYTGSFPIYELNDTRHFILNVAFLQKGFFDYGYSYNAPAWSLSIEAFMYLLFFWQAKYLNVLYTSILFIALGLFMYRLPYDLVFFVNHSISRGLIGFFSGCILYELMIKNNTYPRYRWLIISGYALSTLLYIFYLKDRIVLGPQLITVLLSTLLITESHYNYSIRKILDNRLFRTLGDMSLSIYMIHVPVQLVILLYFKLSNQIIIYDSSFFFAVYGCSVVLVAWVIHVTIEKPAQQWLRNKFSVSKEKILTSKVNKVNLN